MMVSMAKWFTKKSRIPRGVRLDFMSDVKRNCLQGFGYKPGTDAAGTDFNRSNAAIVLDSLDFLKVRIPDGAGLVVRMADVVTEAGAFTANFTFP